MGWARWLTDVAQSVTSSAFVPRDVRIVSEPAVLRGRSSALRLQADRAQEVHPGIGDEVQAFLEETETIAFDLARRSLGRTTIHDLTTVAHEVVGVSKETPLPSAVELVVVEDAGPTCPSTVLMGEKLLTKTSRAAQAQSVLRNSISS